MSLLHLNISSLPYDIDSVTQLLSDIKSNFKITAIKESRQAYSEKKPKEFFWNTKLLHRKHTHEK